MTITTKARAYVSNTGRNYMEWLGSDVVASVHAVGTLATLASLGVKGIAADRVIFPSGVTGITGVRVREADYNAAMGIEAPAKGKAVTTKGAQGGTITAAQLREALALIASMNAKDTTSALARRKGRKVA